jgi:hypothetical protein
VYAQQARTFECINGVPPAVIYGRPEQPDTRTAAAP